ncbi:hypothetical protein KY342_05530 [Candidatus Woesearchaeota archaeon]|nr:hypothetical protein [Candidatus Woesearchaeota archaeon]
MVSNLGTNLRQEFNLVTLIRMNVVSLPPNALDLLINLIASYPQKAESIVRSSKGNIRLIYDEFARHKDAILSSLEGLVTKDIKVDSTPDVTYIGRKNEKPETIFSENLIQGPKLSQTIIPREYPEAKKLFNFLRYEREWITKTLKKAYIIIGEVQREFIYSLSPADLNKFDLSDLAYIMEMHSTTVGRLRMGKYAVVGKQILPVHFLMPNDDSFKKYIAIERINALLAEEPPQSYSDDKLAKETGVARRTVAKWRNEYRIPESRERTRMYKKDLSVRFQIQVMQGL